MILKKYKKTQYNNQPQEYAHIIIIMANFQRLILLILFLCLIINNVNPYKFVESEKDAAIISRNLVKEIGIGTLVTIMNHHEKKDVRGIIIIK